MKLLIAITLLFSNLAFADSQDVEDGDFVGYLRAGSGASSHGGTQNCYYLGSGDGHGYRLGNECDSFTEIGYSKMFAKSDDGVRFIGHIMLLDYSGNSSYSGNIGISQIFVSVLGLENEIGGVPWVGERYYERPDIHWLDLQFINLNGMGGGIDNIPTGWGGKFSYAVFKDNDTENFATNQPSAPVTSSNSAIRNDFLYRGLPLGANGSLDLIAGVIFASSSSSDRNNGYNLHAFYNAKIFGGDNLLGVQYGSGPGTGLGAPVATFDPNNPAQAFGATGATGNTAICCNRMGQSGSTLLDSNTTRLRAFDAYMIPISSRWSAAFDVLYEGIHSPILGGTSNWYSVGTRPVFAISRHFKLQAEVGFDTVDYPQAGTETLLKYTVAPTIALGPGFYDRPELRLFVTHANWNSAAINTINGNNVNSTGALLGATSDTSIGIQLETWWGKNWF